MSQTLRTAITSDSPNYLTTDSKAEEKGKNGKAL
jgi:hypothetical protein